VALVFGSRVLIFFLCSYSDCVPPFFFPPHLVTPRPWTVGLWLFPIAKSGRRCFSELPVRRQSFYLLPFDPLGTARSPSGNELMRSLAWIPGELPPPNRAAVAPYRPGCPPKVKFRAPIFIPLSHFSSSRGPPALWLSLFTIPVDTVSLPYASTSHPRGRGSTRYEGLRVPQRHAPFSPLIP